MDETRSYLAYLTLMRRPYVAIEHDTLRLRRIEEPMPFTRLHFVRLFVLWAEHHGLGTVLAEHTERAFSGHERLAIAVVTMDRDAYKPTRSAMRVT